MDTVIVAGGAGFIGSHLCTELLNKEYRVICIDNLLTSSEEAITPLLKNKNFSFVEHDVVELFSSELLSEEISFIFHLASPASPNIKSPCSYINHPIETMLTNSSGTYNLLGIAREKQACFLFASTSEVYGDPAISPQPEDYFGNVNPNGIRSVYDEAKRFGEAMTMAYVRKYDMNARIVRIFNTYGPNMQVDDGRVVSNFITQALTNKPLTIYGNGEQTRSFCYVSDLVIAMQKAMFEKNTKAEVFNIGNPDERSMRELAEIIIKLTNSKSTINYEEKTPDDPLQRKPDITKARRILGFEPSIGLEEGLRKTIDYFKTKI